MNVNNPNRVRILELVQEADERDQPIQRYKQLAEALGLDVATVKTYVMDWEFRGRLVRSSRGELHVLSANDGEASGVHHIKPLTPEEIESARAESKRPKRAPRPVGWLRQIILGESDKMLEGAAPNNPELAREIIESKTLAEQLREQREVAREARPRRRVVPKRQDAITRIIESDPLPMPKAMPEPARRLLDEHRAQAAALDIAAEQNMMRKMRAQAAREEREIAATGKGSKACRTCLDMPWRRPTEGLCRCGHAFEPETVEISLFRQSSIALCER